MKRPGKRSQGNDEAGSAEELEVEHDHGEDQHDTREDLLLAEPEFLNHAPEIHGLTEDMLTTVAGHGTRCIRKTAELAKQRVGGSTF